MVNFYFGNRLLIYLSKHMMEDSKYFKNFITYIKIIVLQDTILTLYCEILQWFAVD